MGQLFARVILMLSLSSVAACGFQPLYGELTNGTAVNDQLARIGVIQANSKTGIVLRNYLIDQLHPGGRSGNTDYRLSYTLKEGKSGAGERIDASVTRFTYVLTAKYNLIDNQTGRQVYKGESRANVSYDVVDSQFATVVSREDALERAAREVSQDIALRLALFFDDQNRSDSEAET